MNCAAQFQSIQNWVNGCPPPSFKSLLISPHNWPGPSNEQTQYSLETHLCRYKTEWAAKKAVRSDMTFIVHKGKNLHSSKFLLYLIAA
ncbi:unnamed protein product [Haemonchus placei]|uniref:SCP domain-containing protein n=1 Tax=Haemonchus placei TaxID=6290 RepID=A0A0N4W3H5_HAEPC|nr:unnamed protein product [Haemonchus placei]